MVERADDTLLPLPPTSFQGWMFFALVFVLNNSLQGLSFHFLNIYFQSDFSFLYFNINNIKYWIVFLFQEW